VTTGEIIEFVCATAGDIDDDSKDFARSAIRLRYQLLYGAHLWQESIESSTVAVADTDTFFLPGDCELIVFVTIGGKRLAYREADWIQQNAASASAQSPSYFYRAPNLALPTLVAGALTFTVKDTTPINIYVSGTDTAGKLLSEKLLASTTSPSTPATPVTTNSYTQVTTLSKDPSSYPVGVQAADGSSAEMAPSARDSVFTRGTLWPAVSGNADLAVGAKLRADLLEDDMSVPRISRLWNPLIGFTLAALYKRQRQLSKAQAETQDAMQMVQAAISEEKNQAAFRQQVVPVAYDGNVFPWDVVTSSSSNPWGG
jgi:hypothetical protein